MHCVNMTVCLCSTHLHLVSWGSIVATRAQSRGLLGLLPEPVDGLLLTTTALDLLKSLRQPVIARIAEWVVIVRALVPLLLLPNENQEDALALLDNELLEKLNQ